MFETIAHGDLDLLHGAEADIYLQGAHLTRFRDWLFLSPDANFAPAKSIRGGVPVIFPWFGPNKNDASLPQHGWARTAIWQIENASDDALTLSVPSRSWRVRMHFGFGDELRMRLEIENQSDVAQQFECALHTYFAVQNIENVIVAGLDGATYLDKTASYARKKQIGDIAFGGETDRVYLDSPGPIQIREGARTVHINGDSGWRSTVVWNPWQELAAQMSDLGDDSWRRFVCVECGAIADDAVTLQAGENYALDVTIRVENSQSNRLQSNPNDASLSH